MTDFERKIVYHRIFSLPTYIEDIIWNNKQNLVCVKYSLLKKTERQ